MDNRSLKHQLATFIPECILLLIGLASVVLMIYQFPAAYSYITGTEQFGYLGVVADLVIFMVAVAAAIGGGLALLFISLYCYRVLKDCVRWPNHISFVGGIVLITSGIIFLLLFLFL